MFNKKNKNEYSESDFNPLNIPDMRNKLFTPRDLIYAILLILVIIVYIWLTSVKERYFACDKMYNYCTINEINYLSQNIEHTITNPSDIIDVSVKCQNSKKTPLEDSCSIYILAKDEEIYLTDYTRNLDKAIADVSAIKYLLNTSSKNLIRYRIF